jgi:hypothetical protein
MHAPRLQVSPLDVQSLHAAPRVPQVASPWVMHLPFWQQPARQLRRLQEPPLDEPEELPLLDEPEELPLPEEPDELPLEDPDDDGPEHAPA